MADPITTEEVEALFRSHNVDMSNYQFNREEKKPMLAKSFSTDEVLLRQMVGTIVSEVAPETIASAC